MLSQIGQIRLHGRNGYIPLAAVPAILQAEDYEPGERPELCAICHQPIHLGQQFRPESSRPGYSYIHLACDAQEMPLACNVCRQTTRHRYIGPQRLLQTLYLWDCGVCGNTRSGPAPV